MVEFQDFLYDGKFENLKNKKKLKIITSKVFIRFSKCWYQNIHKINFYKRKEKKNAIRRKKLGQKFPKHQNLAFFGVFWPKLEILGLILFFISLLAETYLNTEILIPKSSKSVENSILYDFF